MNRFKRFAATNSALIALIVIFIAAAVIDKDFVSSRNLLNILSQASIIGIISLGQGIVILMGGFDLSVGSSVAFSGACGLWGINSTHSLAVGILYTIVAGALIGLFNGLVITRGRVAPFIATLGTMTIARSLVQYYAKGGTVSGSVLSYSNIGMGEFLGISYSTYVFVILTILVYLLLKKTPFGRYVYAIGSNERASVLSAIRVDRIKLYGYVLTGLLVGIAAVIESSKLDAISASTSGAGYELDSIAAVVIGGTRLSGGRGSMWGTFIGVLIMSILNNIINLLGVDPNLQGVVKGIIIIIAVLIQRTRQDS